jgi:hypothetical protein
LHFSFFEHLAAMSIAPPNRLFERGISPATLSDLATEFHNCLRERAE